MTIKGLIWALKNEVKLCDAQIEFNASKGHDDQFEKGYKEALEMVIDNLTGMGEQMDVAFIRECIEKGDDWCFDKDTLWSLLDAWEEQNNGR